MTPKQRMLAAYRGRFSDQVAVAPELWYYYPAKLLGVDMIEFDRDVAFHRALMHAFDYFGCEGWGISVVTPARSAPDVHERWCDADTLERTHTIHRGTTVLSWVDRVSRDEPGWIVERPVKDRVTDLPSWLEWFFDCDTTAIESKKLESEWVDVGEHYLLEAYIGETFFDWYAGSMGFEKGLYDLVDPEYAAELEKLRERYTAYLTGVARSVCEQTSFESLFIGCSWSCNSLLGPQLWRKWDKPVISAVADVVHEYDRLLHLHFHGRSVDTVADFAEIGIDCVCPFERPPGGDIENIDDVARMLAGKTTFNGNVHTVETLIRGGPRDVRREVGEIMSAFQGNPRLIVGTGDQVGKETPEENLVAMVDESHRLSRGWMEGGI